MTEEQKEKIREAERMVEKVREMVGQKEHVTTSKPTVRTPRWMRGFLEGFLLLSGLDE